MSNFIFRMAGPVFDFFEWLSWQKVPHCCINWNMCVMCGDTFLVKVRFLVLFFNLVIRLDWPKKRVIIMRE